MAMVPIGTEVIRRELEFVPAKYEVTEYVATTYGCPKCNQTEEPCFIKDEGCLPALIEKSYATPSLVADILKNKFVLGLPFYRQEQDLKRSGILVTRASMATWTILVFQLYFQYLVQFFHRELLKRNFLMTYLVDGRCSLSNNMSENSVRPVVVGRKNWLFSDTPDGAKASMGIYTIVEMAKLHGVDPYKYMKYILESRPNYITSDEELEKLAPWSDRVQEICR